MRRRQAQPRAGHAGSNFLRYNPPTPVAEQEGPPVPEHIMMEQVRAAYRELGMNYDAPEPWETLTSGEVQK